MTTAIVTIAVDRHFLCELNNILADAKGNSEELLYCHDQKLGRTTKKNKMTAKMYEDEIAKIDEAVKEIRSILSGNC